jgi:hypothetical protein
MKRQPAISSFIPHPSSLPTVSSAVRLWEYLHHPERHPYYSIAASLSRHAAVAASS